jgi:chaperone BCS1
LELADTLDTAGASKNSPPQSSSVTLSGILNAIDGITSQVGVPYPSHHLGNLWWQESSVLFASTNHPEHLDDALLRPGRFDVHVPFTYAKRAEIAALFKHFYATIPGSEKVPRSDSKETLTGASELDQAADRFADSVTKDGVNVSLAAIQGFLILYKRDLEMAQRKIDSWIEDLRSKQQMESVSAMR